MAGDLFHLSALASERSLLFVIFAVGSQAFPSSKLRLSWPLNGVTRGILGAGEHTLEFLAHRRGPPIC